MLSDRASVCSILVYIVASAYRFDRHWFYEDFVREENPKFPSYPLKKFSAMMFNACPLLQQWSHDHETVFTTFMQYKTRVPVCGAIMLNAAWDKVRFHPLPGLDVISFVICSVFLLKAGSLLQGGDSRRARSTRTKHRRVVPVER